MSMPSVKEQLYERGLTISDIAREAGVTPRAAIKAVERWQGKTGNPRGKTRIVLKHIEQITGKPVYREATVQPDCDWDTSWNASWEEHHSWNG